MEAQPRCIPWPLTPSARLGGAWRLGLGASIGLLSSTPRCLVVKASKLRCRAVEAVVLGCFWLVPRSFLMEYDTSSYHDNFCGSHGVICYGFDPPRD
ncbi:hypothetical protein BHE74_00032540 [Ensete ventricosum]|nr:hypothetical protein BHE74_00032540 [Ensete ventricosum]